MKRLITFTIDAGLVVTGFLLAFGVATAAGASLGGAELCGVIGIAAGMCAAAVR